MLAHTIERILSFTLWLHDKTNDVENRRKTVGMFMVVSMNKSQLSAGQTFRFDKAGRAMQECSIQYTKAKAKTISNWSSTHSVWELFGWKFFSLHMRNILCIEWVDTSRAHYMHTHKSIHPYVLITYKQRFAFIAHCSIESESIATNPRDHAANATHSSTSKEECVL